MTALETAKAVLAKASLTDQTFANPDLGIARAWAEILGDINPQDALTAVAQHYTEETRRLMPADILRRVATIRAERIRTANSALFEPHNIDPNDIPTYLAATRERRARLAAGQPLDPPPEIGPDRTDDVERLMKDTIRSLPRVPKVSPS